MSCPQGGELRRDRPPRPFSPVPSTINFVITPSSHSSPRDTMSSPSVQIKLPKSVLRQPRRRRTDRSRSLSRSRARSRSRSRLTTPRVPAGAPRPSRGPLPRSGPFAGARISRTRAKALAPNTPAAMGLVPADAPESRASVAAQSAAFDDMGTIDSAKWLKMVRDPFSAIGTKTLMPNLNMLNQQVHMLSTITTISVTAVVATGGASSFARVSIAPQWVSHLNQGVTYDAAGVVLTSSYTNVDDYTIFSPMSDLFSPAAVAVRVKYTGPAEKANGVMVVANVNPAVWTSVTTDALVALDSSATMSPSALHYLQMPLLAQQPEFDWAFLAPSAGVNANATLLQFGFKGTSEGLAAGATTSQSFLVSVAAVWAVIPNQEAKGIWNPRVYPLDSAKCSTRLALSLEKVPNNAQVVTAFPDDGPTFLETLDGASKAARGIARAYNGDFSSLNDIADGLRTTYGFITQWLTPEERAARFLLTLGPGGFRTIRSLLAQQERSFDDCQDLHDIVNAGIRKRHKRLFAQYDRA